MPNTQRIKKYGLRKLLLKNTLIVLVSSLLLVTAWSGFSTWFGARLGGNIWTTGTSKACRALLTIWEKAWKHRFDYLVLNDGSDLLQDLEPSELLITVRGNGSIETRAAEHGSAWEHVPSPTRWADVKSSGYYYRDGIFAYVDVRDFPAGSAKKKFVAVRKLDENHLLSPLAIVSNNEVFILRSDGTTIESTFRNRSDQEVFPKFDPQLIADLGKLAPGELHSAHVEVSIPDYNGFIPPQSSRFHRGQTQIPAFISVFPILGADGAQRFYLGVFVPDDAVLHAPKKGIYGSLLLLAVLCCIAGVAVSRFALKMIRPLSEVTRDIDILSRELTGSLRLPPPPTAGVPDRETAAEITDLQNSVLALMQVFAKTNEIRAELDEERARTFTSGKMAALGEMAGGVAHEINSPLATIRMISSQLQEIMGDESIDRAMVQQMASDIENTSIRIAKIVSGLKAFSRNESQDPVVPTELRKVVDETIAFCSEKLRLANIKLTVESIPADIVAECRASQISQVLLNLLNNAHDAIETRQDRWITIAATSSETHVELSVVDSGNGIPSQVLSKLFQPFFTTKEIGKGTGLGLGISKKIVESHGGSLSVDSSCKNTKFVIKLPKAHVKSKEMEEVA